MLVIDFAFTLLIFIGFNCMRRWCWCCINIPAFFHSRSILISSHLISFCIVLNYGMDFFSPNVVMAMPKMCISIQLILLYIYVFIFHSFWIFSNSISSILFLMRLRYASHWMVQRNWIFFLGESTFKLQTKSNSTQQRPWTIGINSKVTEPIPLSQQFRT